LEVLLDVFAAMAKPVLASVPVRYLITTTYLGLTIPFVRIVLNVLAVMLVMLYLDT
jgi:hypothetical protein